MKSIKYLLIALACCLLVHCKKEANNVLPPVVTTGNYSPANQVITGGVSNLSEYVVKYGHIWDTLPNPQLESALGSSMTDYTGALTDSITIITSVNFLPDTKYYIVGYAIDEFEQVIPGQEILEYDPSDPALNPVACFIASQSVCEAGSCSVNFDADCSTPENLIVTYKWNVDGDELNDYAGADKQIISHNYDEAGTYTVRLEVLTSGGITDDTTYLIQVNESTNTIFACFNMSKNECDVDDCTVNFDASCSPNAVSYRWDFDNDGISDEDEKITSYSYNSSGTYDIRLIVEDTDSNADTTFQTIQVYDIEPDFTIPNGTFYENCTPIQFTNNSTGATSYLWDFGDGNTITEENPTHIYENTGEYTITLTAIKGSVMKISTQNINIVPAITFEKIIDKGSIDNYEDVIVLPDGSYVLTGRVRFNQPAYYDVYLIKTDADGNMQWEKTFGDSNIDIGYAIASAPDGGYVIAGVTQVEVSYQVYSNDVYLIKTNSLGDMQWEEKIGDSGSDLAFSIITTLDGGYVLAGYTAGQGAGLRDMYVIKTSANGTMQWEKTFGGTENDEARSIISTSDGGYVLAGYTESLGNGGRDVYLVKTDANGNTQWEKTFGGTENDGAYSLISTPDGGYAIAGQTTSMGTGNMYLIKTDANGNMQWEKTFGNGIAYSIVSAPDGGYTLTGTNGDVYLIKTDSNGNLLWEKTFGGSGWDQANSIKVTDDCGYIIAGEYSGTTTDFYLIKTDSEGNAQ